MCCSPRSQLASEFLCGFSAMSVVALCVRSRDTIRSVENWVLDKMLLIDRSGGAFPSSSPFPFASPFLLSYC